MNRLKKLIIALAAVTAVLVASSAVNEAFEADYPCCGDSSCDTLYAKKACPGGAIDCTYPNTCCGDSQQEARCYMDNND